MNITDGYVHIHMYLIISSYIHISSEMHLASLEFKAVWSEDVAIYKG